MQTIGLGSDNHEREINRCPKSIASNSSILLLLRLFLRFNYSWRLGLNWIKVVNLNTVLSVPTVRWRVLTSNVYLFYLKFRYAIFQGSPTRVIFQILTWGLLLEIILVGIIVYQLGYVFMQINSETLQSGVAIGLLSR